MQTTIDRSSLASYSQTPSSFATNSLSYRTTVQTSSNAKVKDNKRNCADQQSDWCNTQVLNNKASLDIGNYAIDLNKGDSSLILTNKQTGSTIKISGDPHIDTNGTSGTFKGSLTFDLLGNTKVTVGTPGTLREAAPQHENHTNGFFERLDTISDYGALRMFVNSVPPVAIHPEGQMVPSCAPALNQHEIEPAPRVRYILTFAAIALVRFADSTPSGAPTGIQSASAAVDASWATKSRFFEHGTAVDSNPNACIHVHRSKQRRCQGARTDANRQPLSRVQTVADRARCDLGQHRWRVRSRVRCR